MAQLCSMTTGIADSHMPDVGVLFCPGSTQRQAGRLCQQASRPFAADGHCCRCRRLLVAPQQIRRPLRAAAVTAAAPSHTPQMPRIVSHLPMSRTEPRLASLVGQQTDGSRHYLGALHSSRKDTAETAEGSASSDNGSAVKDAAGKATQSLKEQAHNAQDAASRTADSAQQAVEDVKDTIQQAAGDSDIPDFDLPTGVAMGVCSFEAYNEPGPMVGVAEGSDTGTYKLYLDEDYLKEKVAGILQVHVRWAIGVPATIEDEDEDDNKGDQEDQEDSGKRRDEDQGGSTGEVSPFVSVGVGPAVGLTSVVQKSQQAQWRETFFLNVRDPKADFVVKLFNEADGKAEEPADRQPIASASVKLEPYTDGELHDLEISLSEETKVAVSLQYCPLAETSFEEVQMRAVSQMLTDDWSGDEANNVTAPEDSAGGWFEPGRHEWQTSQNMFKASAGDIFKASLPRLGSEEANRLAQNQPPDRNVFKQWTTLLEDIVSRELTERAPPLAFISNPATDTQLWVYRNAEKRDLIFAFRGTSSPKDMITDMSVELKPFEPGLSIPGPSAEEVADELGGGSKLSPVVDRIRQLEEYIGRLTGGGAKQLGLAKWVTSQAQMLYASEHDEVWVHKGFLACYQSVSTSLLELADEAMAGDKQWTIYLTGHSMGGALATLFAYELAQHDFDRAPKPKVEVWGFGSPRVGNIPFAEKYDELDIVTWRISNLNDIVTKVPSLLGFKHVGVEVRLLGEGEVAVKKGTFDEVREGTAFGDLVDGIRDGTFGENKELQKQFRDIVRAELATSKSIVKGDAMKEHMEDYYYEAVKLAVEAAGDGCSPKMVAQEAVEKAAKNKEEGGKGGHKMQNDEDGQQEGEGDRGNGNEEEAKAKREDSEDEEPEAQTENGGNGARTGKRRGTVGGGVGKGKGESDKRRLPEDDEDTDGSEEDREDSDVESLDDEFSSESDSDCDSVDSEQSDASKNTDERSAIDSTDERHTSKPSKGSAKTSNPSH